MKRDQNDRSRESAATIRGLIDFEPFADALLACVYELEDGDACKSWAQTVVGGVRGRLDAGVDMVAGVDGMSEDAAAVAVAASLADSPFGVAALLPLLTLTEERANEALTELEKLDVIRAVDDGGHVFTLAPRKRDSAVSGREEPATSPSQREWDVADLIARGLTNYQIGIRLGVSERTIETYVRRLFMKLRVSSRSQIAVWYMNQSVRRG